MYQPLRLIKSPLDGVVILGQTHGIIGIGTMIRKLFYCPETSIRECGREVESPKVRYDESWKWHVDKPHRFMFTMCLAGPGTEFIAKPSFMRKYDFCSDEDVLLSGGKVYPRYNFPNGVLLLIDNERVAHRVPPWLRRTRYVYRWVFEELDDAQIISNRLSAAGLA